jgi:hypothetical protein
VAIPASVSKRFIGAETSQESLYDRINRTGDGCKDDLTNVHAQSATFLVHAKIRRDAPDQGYSGLGLLDDLGIQFASIEDVKLPIYVGVLQQGPVQGIFRSESQIVLTITKDAMKALAEKIANFNSPQISMACIMGGNSEQNIINNTGKLKIVDLDPANVVWPDGPA